MSGLGQEIAVIEYRNGNEKLNSVRKLPGLNKVPDVTFKRGIIGSLALYQWVNQIRNGDAAARRTVRIQLQNEDRSATVMSWTLLQAWPVRQVHGPLNAKGTDVADGGAHARLRAPRDRVSDPFTAFNFRVEIMLPGAAEPLCEAAFAECEGLELRHEVITVREGGDAGSRRLLPGSVSFGEITLRRGMTESFDLWSWFADLPCAPTGAW